MSQQDDKDIISTHMHVSILIFIIIIIKFDFKKLKQYNVDLAQIKTD